MSPPADVAIIGGGIIGCSAAAFLAEAGVKVDVYERAEVGSAASGRNSGSVQHPFDPALAELHADTLRHYREVEELDFPDAPAGVLMLAAERETVEPAVADIAADAPELRPELLDSGELTRLEPALADDLWGCRLETGYPVHPIAATRALARRAFAAGAQFHEGETAWPWVIGGRARGVLAAGVRRPTDAVLVAAGPWTPEVIDPTRAWRPIVPVWGVVVEVEMPEPPRHMLEEAGVEQVVAGVAASIFTLIPAAEGRAAIGSTFMPAEEDPAPWAGPLRRGGQRFVPALERAKVVGARTCARPQSFDGRPLVGELPEQQGVWLAAGHGPWGISTGPGTAQLVTDALLGRAEIPAALSAGRF